MPRARRLLFVHHGGGLGGAPLSLIQSACKLRSFGYEPEIVFTDSGPILEILDSEGVNVEVVRLPSAFFYGMQVPLRVRMLLRWMLTARFTFRRAIQLMEERRPDLVHLNSSVLLPVARAVRKAGIPLVWHIREVPGPNRHIRNWYGRQIVNLADAVIATSQYVRDALPGSDRVVVVHNGVDLDPLHTTLEQRRQERKKLAVSQKTPIVLILGNVQKVKGHFFLLQAASRVVSSIPQTRFVVASGGAGSAYHRSWKGRVKMRLGLPIDNRERLQRSIQAAGLKETFRFVEFRKDISGLLAAADLLVFPSLLPEGFGRPLIESMAAGLPVVATDIGPTREIVGETAGLLIKPGDVRALSDSMVELLANREKAQGMARCGRERAHSLFGLKRQLDSIDRVYRQVLGNFE